MSFSRIVFLFCLPLRLTVYSFPFPIPPSLYLCLTPQLRCQTKDAKRAPSLWRVFVRTYWRQMAAGGAFKVLGDAVNCVAPLAIALIVTYVTDVQAGTLVRSGVVVDKVSDRWTDAKAGRIFLLSALMYILNHINPVPTVKPNLSHSVPPISLLLIPFAPSSCNRPPFPFLSNFSILLTPKRAVTLVFSVQGSLYRAGYFPAMKGTEMKIPS